MSFGSSKNPSCEGFTVEQIANLDWDEIDLSEWVALLEVHDLMPDIANIDMENLTGEGSAFDLDGTRQDAEERAHSRMEGIEGDDIRTETGSSMDLPVF